MINLIIFLSFKIIF